MGKKQVAHIVLAKDCVNAFLCKNRHPVLSLE